MQELDLSRLITLEAFPMAQLGRTRRVQVYLPKGYTESNRSYPVIYMHDGQTIFDGENAFGGRNWHVHSSLDHFFDDQSGVILVGIDNGTEHNGLCRMYEYSPWPMDQAFELPSWILRLSSPVDRVRRMWSLSSTSLSLILMPTTVPSPSENSPRLPAALWWIHQLVCSIGTSEHLF